LPQVYGGTLGLIAFLAIVARGLANGMAADATLLAASTSLPIFFLVGCVIGWIADRTVDESIRAKIETYLNTDKQGAGNKTRTNTPATR
jgi:hypothetical protein